MNAPLSIRLRVFFPFAAGYFLSYLYRTINANGGYALQGYQAGFAAVLAPQVLALGWFWWAGRMRPQKEKNGQTAGLQSERGVT